MSERRSFLKAAISPAFWDTRRHTRTPNLAWDEVMKSGEKWTSDLKLNW